MRGIFGQSNISTHAAPAPFSDATAATSLRGPQSTKVAEEAMSATMGCSPSHQGAFGMPVVTPTSCNVSSFDAPICAAAALPVSSLACNSVGTPQANRAAFSAVGSLAAGLGYNTNPIWADGLHSSSGAVSLGCRSMLTTMHQNCNVERHPPMQSSLAQPALRMPSWSSAVPTAGRAAQPHGASETMLSSFTQLESKTTSMPQAVRGGKTTGDSNSTAYLSHSSPAPMAASSTPLSSGSLDILSAVALSDPQR